MRQRTSIVRALIHDPPLLLMDEPFGALDALTREQMRIDLEALWLRTRKTVLFVTHSIDEAVLLADRVVVMSPRPGRIEQIIEVGLPRPRGIDARQAAGFRGDHAADHTDLSVARHSARLGLVCRRACMRVGDSRRWSLACGHARERRAGGGRAILPACGIRTRQAIGGSCGQRWRGSTRCCGGAGTIGRIW